MIAGPARGASAADAAIAHEGQAGDDQPGWLASHPSLARSNAPGWDQDATTRVRQGAALLGVTLLTDVVAHDLAAHDGVGRDRVGNDRVGPTRAAAAWPHPTAVAIHQRGEASWYGEAFAGRPTASGEPFDPGALTAAHRDLPLGSRVLVTAADGRQVVVRVNDRGPYQPGSNGAVDHPSRVIDLSQGAAQQLGAVEAGVVEVRLQVLSRP